MASPQVENGHLRLSNELLEAIYRATFTSAQLRVTLWVIRNSYGWNRKYAAHPGLRKMADELNVEPSTILRALADLCAAKVLRKNAAGHWELLKDYDLWALGVAPTQQGGVLRPRNKSVAPTQLKVAPTQRSPYAREKTVKTIKDKDTGAGEGVAPTQQPKPYKIETNEQRVMCCYKITKGVRKDDRVWDKVNWKRYVKDVERLLEIFNDDWRMCARCIEGIGDKLDAKGMDSWSLAAIVRLAYDWKIKNEQNAEAHGNTNGAVDVRSGDDWKRNDADAF